MTKENQIKQDFIEKLKEQQKIAITLKKHKKGLMQQLFPSKEVTI